jgi:hypothetical protein
VKGDGHNQKDRTAPGCFDSFGVACFVLKVKVGQDAVSQAEKGAAQEEARQGGKPAGNAGAFRLNFGHGDCRFQKGPETGGYHHAAGKAQHAVKDFTVDVFEEKDRPRAKGGNAVGKKTGQKGLENNVLSGKPVHLNIIIDLLPAYKYE